MISSNSTETDTTPLAPFNDATGQTFYTSDNVRSTETFNYAYPETQRWAYPSDSAYQASVQTAVQTLYGGVSNQFAGLNLVAKPAALAAAPAKEHAAQKPLAEPAAPAPAPHHAGFHPIQAIKKAFEGEPSNLEESTRGLDLESEIGTCTSPIPFALPHSFLTNNQTQHQ